MSARPILVYGSKEFGRVIRALVHDAGFGFAGFVDDFATGPDIVGSYDQVRLSHPPSSGVAIVIAIGYEHIPARWSVFEKVRRDGYHVPALVHPTAIVHSSVSVGDGAIVMSGANVDVFSEIGALAVLWPGVIVSHDSRVGANSFLSPGSILCGFVTTGTGCFIGAGAVVADHRTVPAGAFVKAAGLYK